MIFHKSDRLVNKRERDLNAHEKSCAHCNLWMKEQFEAMDLKMLIQEDKRRRKKGLRRIAKNLERLKKKEALADSSAKIPALEPEALPIDREVLPTERKEEVA